MTLEPITPRRQFIWPDLISQIAQSVPDSDHLYLVGGIVRDALRGQPIHDIDLAADGDGLKVARQIANALNGAYYPIDAERKTGRAILPTPEGEIIVDVASFRDVDLLGDLQHRDFTINAMAVRLSNLEMLIDPLGGQEDLFDRKRLNQCNPGSISSDPIRALRAIRMSLQFGLRMALDTREAARNAASALANESGKLLQAERVRDEFLKMLAAPRPASALRLMHSLDLLSPVLPFALPDKAALEWSIRVIEHLDGLLNVISPKRNDNTAADMLLGVAVMVLDRYRQQLQEHLWHPLTDGVTRSQLLFIVALTPPNQRAATAWAEHLRLSNDEKRVLAELSASRDGEFPPEAWWEDRDRTIYRYYQRTGGSGVDGVVLALAEYMTTQGMEINGRAWGQLLDDVASPLLAGFFRRYQQVIAPPPLLSGSDLMEHLGLQPGRQIGTILAILAEERAAGVINTKKEALRLAKRLATESQQDSAPG
jgi:tRNA nucleotidyltransferase/poly(A) polymerase